MLEGFLLSRKGKATTRNKNYKRKKLITKDKYTVKGENHPYATQASRKVKRQKY